MSDLVRYALIIIVTAGVAFTVFQLGEKMRQHPSSHGEHSLTKAVQESARQNRAERETTLPDNFEPEAGTKLRKLADYYANRAYYGAPPIIPHEVDPVIAHGQRCNVCHERGGFVRKFNAYAPITPHPEFANCMQCHVTQQTQDVFVEHDWVAVQKPDIHRPMLPGSPPPLPHPLQMRENCISCHAGPSAVRSVHTTHPERENCLQCHVAQGTTGRFERK